MRKIFALLFLLAFPEQVLAFGEIFKVEAVGAEYCGDYAFTRLNASNNIDLWVRVDSGTLLTISVTSDFSSFTFPMNGAFYLTGNTAASFTASVFFEDGSWASIGGTARFGRAGDIKSLTGTYTQRDVFHPGCFSIGPVKTVQRLR